MWPEFSVAQISLELIGRVLLLQEHNTRLVVISTSILGMASGLIGGFLLLRKRSLMGDALSHACLPGLGIAFLILVAMGGSGRNLPILLAGATLTGMAGTATVLYLRNHTKIKDDAAMGIVLSVFFGLGVALLGVIQSMPQASAAGLESFIYGKTASMLKSDFLLISGVALTLLLGCLALYKEFALLCFDEAFAESIGWPVVRLDLLLLTLVAAVTVVGFQAVGLILIIAFLIIPAAAARFWTLHLARMLTLSALIGGVSGWLGASLSALLPGLPAGAVIVLVATGIFILSLFFGSARGVVPRQLSHLRLRRKVGRQHLLRAVYEIQENLPGQPDGQPANLPVAFESVLAKRSWTPGAVRRLIRRARAEDHVEAFDRKKIHLSESGFGEAARTTRNHRLWEIFMITHADVAPSHVDRDADSVEHILSPEMVRELEQRLGPERIPPSPHALNPECCTNIRVNQSTTP